MREQGTSSRGLSWAAKRVALRTQRIRTVHSGALGAWRARVQPRWPSRTGLSPGCVLETAPRAGTGGGVEPRPPWSAAVTSSVDGWLGPCVSVHPSWTLGCPQCMAAADLGPSQQVRQSYQEQRLCGHVCGVRLCVCTWCLCVWCACGTCAGDPGKATFQHHPHSSPQQPGKLWLPHQGRGVLTLLWSRPLPHPGWSRGGRSPCPLSL